MGIRIMNVVHPKTGKTTSATPLPDGGYRLAEGDIVEELRQDDGGGAAVILGLLISTAILVGNWLISS